MVVTRSAVAAGRPRQLGGRLWGEGRAGCVCQGGPLQHLDTGDDAHNLVMLSIYLFIYLFIYLIVILFHTVYLVKRRGLSSPDTLSVCVIHIEAFYVKINLTFYCSINPV